MSDTPTEEIFGRHDKGAAPETGAAAQGEAVRSETPATETVAAEQSTEADPLGGLKSALDKERERATKFEKDWKASQREARRRDQQTAMLEREVQALRAQATRPDPKAQEEAFWSANGGPTEFINQGFTSLREELTRERIQERAEISKEIARDRYEDFEEVEAVFLEAAAKDESHWNGVMEKRLPALEVYKRGKKILAGAETAPESRIAKLEAEIAELKAGRDGGQPSAQTETVTSPAAKPTVPKSNAGLRSTGVGKTTSWAGPTPTESVWGRQRAAR